MEIIIDNRETKIKDFFKNKDYVKTENLDLGDVVFKYNNEVILLVERKTLQDLANSIKDGRYKEQKARLLGNYPKDKILYLIEGNMNQSGDKLVSGISIYTLFSCLMNMLLRDNIKVYKSENINETIRFIKNLVKKIKKQGLSFLEKKNCVYAQTLKIRKKDNLTPEICFLYQLSQIPGVSYRIASVVAEKYPSMFELVKYYLNETEIDKRKIMLSDIKLKLNNGKERRIGKKASINIYTYLVNPNISC